ncbi:MAG: hypothetical protein KGJ56_07965 [Gammaproteobacteria bacterium]|nr:hypothetical protein [Gammaproteobacteria bacterium]
MSLLLIGSFAVFEGIIGFLLPKRALIFFGAIFAGVISMNGVGIDPIERAKKDE